MPSNLQSFIELFPGITVTVIGEAMLDTYLEGSSNRICREAPVPIVAVEKRTDQPGGAANTAVNLAALGVKVNFLSVTGNDTEGELLQASLKAKNVSTKELIVTPDRQTISKQRIIAAGQLLVRFDQGSEERIDVEVEQALIEGLISLYGESDAVILSDYGYGIITPRIIETIKELQSRYDKVLVADAKNLSLYREIGLTAVKPNFGEALALLKEKDSTLQGRARADFLASQQEKFLDITGAKIVAVTMDSEGALIFEQGQPYYRTYARPNSNSKAAGAGDTFVSALTAALAAGATASQAAELASVAAAVVVNKDGTSSCSAGELQEHFLGDPKYFSEPVSLVQRLENCRNSGKRIVFTNGCFDILHPGHISFLNQAKELGDILVVAVNSDNSVAQLKGAGRPINTLEDRLKVLGALSCIDYLVSFEELLPEKLIKELRPDIVVKGGNYSRDILPEAGLIEAQGGKLVFLPYLPDRSTSTLLERIREVLDNTAAVEPAPGPFPVDAPVQTALAKPEPDTGAWSSY